MADINVGFYPQAQPNALLATAGNVVDLANAAQQNKLLGVQTQQAHQDLVKQQVGSLVDVFSALATDPNVTGSNFMQRAQTLLQEGVISPDVFNAEIANVKQAGDDPDKLHALANGYLSRALDAGQRFGVATGMQPGTSGDLVTYTGPNGATVTNTRGNVVGQIGAPNPLDTSAPAPATDQGGGAAASTIHTSVPSQPATAQQPASAGITAPSPQQQKQFTDSAQQQQDDLTADAGFTSNIVPLTKTLKLLPDTTIGLGSEIPNDVAKVFSTFGLNFGSDAAQNASEVDKYLTQLVRSSGAAANTDHQLEAAFSANPNMTTDKAAATDVLKTMLSLTRMQHAKVAAAQAAGIAPENYSKWASQWGAQQDPRAFGVDLMTPEAKAALLADLKKDPAAKAKFLNSLQLADGLGVLDNAAPPNGQ